MNTRRYGLGAALFGLVIVGIAVNQIAHHPAVAVSPAAKNVPNHTPVSPTWTKVTVSSGNQLPIGKEGIALAAQNGRLYTVGGYTGSYSTTSVFEVYPSVRQVATLPQPSHDSAAGFIGSDLYVFGGGQATSYDSLLRVSNGNTTSLANLPRPLSDAVTVPWTDHGTHGLLLIGGYDGTVFNTQVTFYSQNTDGSLRSKPMFTLPVGVRYPGVATLGQTIIIAGGETSANGSNPTSAVFEWTPKSGIRTLAHLPSALQKAAAFLWNGHVIIAGGYTPDGSPSSTVWDVRLSDHHVRQIGHLPIPLADMGYTQVGRTGYLIGGSTSGGSMNKTLYRLTFR